MVLVSRFKEELGCHWLDGHLRYKDGGLQKAYRAAYPHGTKQMPSGPDGPWRDAVQDYGMYSLRNRPNSEVFFLWLPSSDPVDASSYEYHAVERILREPIIPPGFEWLYDEIRSDRNRFNYRGIILVGNSADIVTSGHGRQLRKDLEGWGFQVKPPREYLDAERWRQGVTGLLDELIEVYAATDAPNRYDALRGIIGRTNIHGD